MIYRSGKGVEHLTARQLGNVAYGLMLSSCEDEEKREALKREIDTVGNPEREALARFEAHWKARQADDAEVMGGG